MARHRPRSPADRRRRALGQNLLTDRGVITRAVDRLDLDAAELVVEVGPGRGALTLPLARAGARVVAVEQDPVLAAALRDRVRAEGLDQVRVVHADVRRFRWPGASHRVVGNLPFNLTTAILERVLGDPAAGPWRVDVLVQAEVARKRAASPPSSLRSAAWAPWWEVEQGPVVPRQAFRPVPSVDGAWLTYRRRADPVLPERLAPGFIEVLRPAWEGRG